MNNAGFKALARGTCVGHAYSFPVRWNCPVEVFGCPVKPGDLIHADKHGFLVIPPEDQERLLEAVLFMDANECRTLIPAARGSAGRSVEDTLRAMDEAGERFGRAVKERFGDKGEW
jgi:regulator of RNase E activity RraA